MNLNKIFDTLVYGKGTVKRGDYFMYTSVLDEGSYDAFGRKIEGDFKTMNYFINYKGETVLMLQEMETDTGYETVIMYDGRDKHNFSKNINKTLDKIVSYMIDSYEDYRDKYGI